MFADLWNWIVSSWWAIVLSGAASSLGVSFWFNSIIDSEMSRGGEEYAERAITRIQKWSIAILIMSIGLAVAVVAFKVLEVLGIIKLGN